MLKIASIVGGSPNSKPVIHELGDWIVEKLPIVTSPEIATRHIPVMEIGKSLRFSANIPAVRPNAKPRIPKKPVMNHSK